VIAEGHKVKVHYEGSLDSGKVFDSSRDREPLEFVIGSGAVITGFEQAVCALSVGETVKIKLESEEAYGERDESLVFDLPAEGAPDGLRVGDQVMLDGDRPAVVTEMTTAIVKADANHLLAGQALTFEIELVAADG
jgi:FKBP-type peptidyl-prolyl cis-trans isomerase 2